MFGGIATWNRENNSFQIHKSGNYLFIIIYFQ